MSRPADQAASATPPPQRTLRRIERADGGTPSQSAPAAAPATDSHEIRRLARPGQSATPPATTPAEDFTGRWVADSAGAVVAWMKVKVDGTFDFAMANGTQYTGDLTTTDGRQMARFNMGVGTIPFYIARAGEALVLTGIGAAAPTSRYHRDPAGRQP